jgi:hypothetical protein
MGAKKKLRNLGVDSYKYIRLELSGIHAFRIAASNRLCLVHGLIGGFGAIPATKL